jgi:hypothetical protein
LCKLCAQCFRIHEVREGPLPVDLDDRQQLPIAILELWIPGDVDLLQLERLLGARRVQDAPRGRAEVAAVRVVEGDVGYG